MVFEPLHPRLDLKKRSPLRRAVAAALGLAVIAFLIWCGVTAYDAKPLDAPAPHRPAHARGAA